MQLQWLSLTGLSWPLVLASPPLTLTCALNEAGLCRDSSTAGLVDICGSGQWLRVPKGAYECVDGEMVPQEAVPIRQTSDFEEDTDVDQPIPGGLGSITGHSYCTLCGRRNEQRQDHWGVASYDGPMASVYDAEEDAVFSCEDVDRPADDFYVALWTKYDAGLVKQLPPRNCGDYIRLRNPFNGKSAEAVVLDRCQSCVGVSHQTDDPTTPDYLVNGATIDLSRALWDYLYDDAPDNVYDIRYNRDTYAGTTESPSLIIDPNCSGAVAQSCDG